MGRNQQGGQLLGLVILSIILGTIGEVAIDMSKADMLRLWPSEAEA